MKLSGNMIEIFIRLTEEKITPNSFYTLICIKENIVPNSYINKELEIKKLINDKWLNNDLTLSNKSIIFVTEINSYFKSSKKKTSKILMGDNFIDKIKEYVEIFPNKKLTSGKYARVNPKNLETAFRWFFDNYNYDWDTIIKATDKYVDEFSIRKYEFMRTAQYFIRKQAVDKTFESDLANYCDLIINGSDEEQVYFKENVV
jgi:hypothetical protein